MLAAQELGSKSLFFQFLICIIRVVVTLRINKLRITPRRNDSISTCISGERNIPEIC